MVLSMAYPQADTAAMIKVNFLYGSKPKRKFKETEVKSFGGLHGGHVSVQVGDTDYGFGPTVMPVHIFPKRRRKSVFEARESPGIPSDLHRRKSDTKVGKGLIFCIG